MRFTQFTLAVVLSVFVPQLALHPAAEGPNVLAGLEFNWRF